MKRTFSVLGLTFILVAILDVAVAFTLNWAERTWRFGGLVQYFEYGRSVPGKLDKWQTNPDAGFNLYDVGWRAAGVDQSALQFANETGAPVIRSYGMSFVNNVIKNAVARQPELLWDDHAGPGVPPNYTYAYFEDDRANRRAGDINVLGILSSTVPVMASFSNQTWAFEQPAPLTYPIYLSSGDGLTRIDPVITSAEQQSTLATDLTLTKEWHAQLASHDAYFGMQTHGAPFLDASPLARLIRRSAATAHVSKVKADILRDQTYPYETVLNRMITTFAQTSHADGQFPIVMLIQDNAAGADLRDITQSVMAREGIKYLATADQFDPSDPSGFLSDGHYTPHVDGIFGAAFLKLIAEEKP